MPAVIYLSGIAVICCIAWLVVSTVLRRDVPTRPWRSALLPVIASSVATAAFLMARFVVAEAPVSAGVVARGWVGFLLIFTAVFSAAAALMLAVARHTGPASRGSDHQPSAR